MQSESALEALKAIAEPTRLRMLAVIRRGEVTVTDLTEILGQSQPRVSRHLRLLADAGLVTKHREGAWAFFRLADSEPHRTLVATALDAIDPDDPTSRADVERLDAVRARRSDVALEYFEQIAPIWDEERSLHAAAGTVEAAIVEIIGDERIGRVLDVGTGTGRMLQLVADRADRAVGLDSSHSMLSVARANLERMGATNWELRQGDVHSPPLSPRSFDLVVVHQVLHYLDDPSRALGETARLVAPGGRLLVIDFAPHQHEFLRSAAHRRLGFAHEQLRDWLEHAGLECTTIVDVDPPERTDGLTVTLWVGTNTASHLSSLHTSLTKAAG